MILEVEKNGKKKIKIKQKKSPSVKNYVVIDHPQNGEILNSNYYTLRIGASSAKAQIAIDGSDWMDCRCAAGYFWYDWTDISQGSHKLTARIQTVQGEFKTSKSVQCQLFLNDSVK